MKTLFLINSRSGAKRRYDVSAIVRESCRDWTETWEINLCREIDELDDIVATAAAEGYEIIYAVGGDGTVHEIAKRLIGTKLILGILPTGSGNGFARHLGLPVEPRASLQACLARRIERIDTAVVNGRAFLGVMGMGFDAVIADRFASSKVRGLRTYAQIGLAGFARYKAEEYAIDIDGHQSYHHAFVVAVANASQYGNGARIAPTASVTDGLLNVVIIPNPSLFGAPALLARLFAGTLHRSQGVTMLTGKRVLIRRNEEAVAHLDGEPLSLPADLDVNIRPSSLRVLLPDQEGRI